MKPSGSILKRGAIAGLLGAATVALWFLALDVAAGHPFRTPAALGKALLFGGVGPSQPIDINFRVVAAYTVVHIVAFLFAGWVFTWIAEQVQRRPSFVLLAAMTVIVLEALAVVNLAYGAQWGGVDIWSIIVANILAVAVMSWYVWRTHPTLRNRLATTNPAQVRV
jgi:hypothetical protein